jgi:peroxiredoxin
LRALARLAGLILAIAACGGGSRAIPVWEQPGLYGAARPEMGPPQPGDRAPDFELSTAGATFRSTSLRGNWALLHFTASWCPYCDAEVDHLGELAQAYAGRGLRVVLIGVKEDPARWTEYVRTRVASSVLALSDADGSVAARYAPPRAQPSFVDRSQVVLDSTLIVDPAGTIRLFLFPDTKHFDPTFAAVRREIERLTSGGGGSAPAVAVADPPLLPPEQVVSIDLAAPQRVSAGERGEVRVTLTISGGYHVMSDRPSDPTFIATRVDFDVVDGMTWGPPRYPAPVGFAVDARTISTFQGQAEIQIPFSVAAGAVPARRTLTGRLRYQACTRASCLFPVTRPIALEMDVGDR